MKNRLARKKRILIVRTDSIGDLFLFTGVLRKISQVNSEKNIHIVCQLAGKELFKEIAPDRLKCCAIPGASRSRRWYLRFFRKLRYTAFLCGLRLGKWEMVINPVWSTKLIAHLIIAKVVGKQKIWFSPGETFDVSVAENAWIEGIYSLRIPVEREEPEIDKNLALLRSLGYEVRDRADIWPDIGLTERERFEAREVVGRGVWEVNYREIANNACNILRVVVCAGARYKQKDWGQNKFAELFKRMVAPEFLEEFGYDGIELLFLGEKGDWENNEKIKDSITAKVQGDEESFASSRLRGEFAMLNLAGKTTIRQSVAVIAECDLCIGNDTFGLHAAISEHTPSVVILGRQEGDRWGPWGDPCFHRAATLPGFECEKPNCGWECPYSPYKCIQQISVEQVIGRISDILANMHS